MYTFQMLHKTCYHLYNNSYTNTLSPLMICKPKTTCSTPCVVLYTLSCDSSNIILIV